METMIELDHPYSRHWSESYKSDHSHAKPIHWLLPSCRSGMLAKGSRLRSQHVNASSNSNTSSDGSDDELDVESLDEVMAPYVSGRSYDVHRARLNMNETERFTSHNLLSGKVPGITMRSDTDWEEYINKSSWSMQQARLFTKVVKVLEDEKLARLAFKGVNNEPIARRLSLDRSAACLRRIMAEFSWEQKLSQWLHSLLTNRLPASMLASYLDLIQTLRSKVPTLVERMIAHSANESGSGSLDCLNLLLKRPWEPTLIKYPQNPKQRLYDPPIFLLIPNSPYAPSPTMAHRKRFWNSHLGQLGKVVPIAGPEKVSNMTILSYIEQLATMVRSRINFYHNKHPSRSIVLVGWHTASILSCHISLVEKVSAVICLGFPMQSLNGSRGTVDDVFCDLNTPMLFVIGEEADSCEIDQLEDFREQLLTRCESNLLAVPGADDALRVSDKVKKTACVTQHMVDKMISDYIGNFLSDTLIKNKVESWRIAESHITDDIPYLSRQQPLAEGKRKRDNIDDNLAEIKRRRLSSSTTAKISEILSGHSTSRGKEGVKIPVQGLAYNLQTGSMSGLATVPTVLGRSLSKSNNDSSSLVLKHGKISQKNRNQQRSITIDLTKETSTQLKSRKVFGASPDPTLLATESQTEAAVATILGGNPTAAKLPVHKVSAPNKVTTPPESPTVSTNSSAFTRFSTANSSASTSTAVTTVTPLPGSDMNSATPATNPGSYPLPTIDRVKSMYTNVKFNSTVATKKPVKVGDSLSTINKHHWTGVTGSSLAPAASSIVHDKTQEFHRKYPYLSPQNTEHTAQSQTHIVSRSRKEERETMQATAFLEQLTSGDDVNQAAQSTSPMADVADSVSYRRHSYDSTHLSERGAAGRGRGRIRTRGGSSSQLSQPRQITPKRRKTVNEERSTPPTYYQQKIKPHQPPRQESYVRYVMTSDMSTILSNAAAKAAAASGRSFQKLPRTQVSVISDKPKTPVAKTSAKPSMLPVYTFTQPRPTNTTAPRVVQHLVSSAARTSSKGTAVTTSKVSTQVTQVTDVKKTPRVFLSQRVPVKFPGAVPGSSYTFVTIPALVGQIPSTGLKNQQGAVKKVTPTPLPVAKQHQKERLVKYSVFPRSDVMITTSPITKPTVSANTRSAQQTTVSLRDKALAKPVGTPGGGSKSPTLTVANPKVKPSIPIFSSPSVVLQKLWTETVAELDTSSNKDKPKK